jgi:hypothetical protein
MDDFKSALQLIFLAKQLHEIGRYEVFQDLQNNVIAYAGEVFYDTYIEAAVLAIESVFKHCVNKYYENKGLEIYVLSDVVVTDYFILAGEYGRRHKLDEKSNPYIISAREEVERWFNFSYSLSVELRGYTEPKRPFQSRLVIMTYADEWLDYTAIAIGTVAMYRFLADKCAELRELLSDVAVV